MNIRFVEALMLSAVSMILKVSLLLAAVAIAQALLQRRTSAATRHQMWSLTVAGLLILPLLSAGLPRWDVAVLPATATPPEVVSGFHPTSLGAGSRTVTGHISREPGAVRLEPDTADANGLLEVAPDAESAPEASAAIHIPWTMAMTTVYLTGTLLLFVRLAVEHIAI